MIQVADSAIEKVKQIQVENSLQGYGLRVGVRGGGCSGLSYMIEFTENPEEGDYVWESDGVKVYCDRKSYLYLIGTELVYKETIKESGFVFDNPNSRKSCGCGESFSI